MLEYFFTCPYCLEKISMLLDLSIPHQKYIEDCEVCCNPLEIEFEASKGEIMYFACNPAN